MFSCFVHVQRGVLSQVGCAYHNVFVKVGLDVVVWYQNDFWADVPQLVVYDGVHCSRLAATRSMHHQ